MSTFDEVRKKSSGGGEWRLRIGDTEIVIE